MTASTGHGLPRHLWQRRARVVGGIGLVAFSAGACSSPDEDSAAGPIAVYQTDTADGAGELLPGRLQLLDGACIVYEAGSETLVPVFPEGTEWDADSTSIRLPDGGTELLIGEEIELGGGHVEEADDSMSIPSECPSDLEYYVVAP